ncbi:MAG: 1,4-dihydroxy-2-naphthoate polyprenyltransferase, partial [Chloroflexota bacterium]
LTAPVSAATPRPGPLRTWVLAIRPRTLPAAIAPVCVGLGVTVGSGVPLRVDAAVGCFLVALLLQVLANLVNDLADFRKGADTPDRQGPLRVAAAGLISPRALSVAIALVTLASGAAGLWLVTIGGPVLLVVGAAAILAAFLYTGGPLPYGYRGLGEVFVFLFFGLVAVVGTAYLQSGTMLAPLAWAAAIPVGALVTAIIVVNNLRDRPTDAAAGKRTLAVSFGDRFAQAEYIALLAVGFAFPVAIALLAVRPAALLALLAIALVPPLAGPMLAVGEGSDRRARHPVLGGTARLALVASLLLAAGLALGRLGLG